MKPRAASVVRPDNCQFVLRIQARKLDLGFRLLLLCLDRFYGHFAQFVAPFLHDIFGAAPVPGKGE